MINEQVKTLITDPVRTLGYDVVMVEYKGAKGKQTGHLIVFIERLDDARVSITDCEKVSSYLSTLLDVHDPIAEQYNLEVSSLGVNRPLFSKTDYERFQGEKIKCKLHGLVAGILSRNFCGVITQTLDDGFVCSVSSDSLTNPEEAEITINFENIKKCNLDQL